ncbi:MAG: SBBP repeat-containing protein [Acidimicrobiales bacterium]
MTTLRQGRARFSVGEVRRLSVKLAAVLAVVATTSVAVPVAGGASGVPATPRGTAGHSTAGHSTTADEVLDRLPLRFEANRGQTDPQAQFLARGRGYRLFLTANEAIVAPDTLGSTGQPGEPTAGAGDAETAPAAAEAVRLAFVGADPRPEIAGVGEFPGASNYLGSDGDGAGLTDVPSYGEVRYRQLYPGIDLVFGDNQGQVEYDFVVAPGADPGAIAVDVDGPGEPVIDAAGDLVVETASGTLRQSKPVLYQERDGERHAVTGAFALRGDGRVGFEVGDYDPDLALVIDPVISYSTFLGGAGFDSGLSMAVDPSGNAYVAGRTASPNFPTTGAVQPVFGGGTDVFVAKLGPDGSTVAYATYLGGAGSEFGNGIAVDSSGSAYVTGSTNSADFPTANPLQPAGGGTDAFVARLNPAGSALVYATHLGGTAADSGNGIAVDGAGSAYVTGSTDSTDFPTTSAVQPASGGGTDAFVAKVAADGSVLDFATYLGGTADDSAFGVALGSGTVYVAGSTESTDFPTTAPFQWANAGGSDAFLAGIALDGSAVGFATYLGGSGDDTAFGVAADSGGAYLAGSTDSPDFPTANAAQPAYGGGNDAFVTKVNTAGSALAYSTYLGGTYYEQADAVAVHAGEAYLIGQTGSADFPAVNPVAHFAGNFDAFAAKVEADGSAFAYASALGGVGNDRGRGIAVDGAGNAYVSGQTDARAKDPSANFPLVGPLQAANGGSADAFIAKLAADVSAAPLVTGTAPRSGPASGETPVVITGRGFTGASAVRFGAVDALSFSVDSPTQITAVSPAQAKGTVAVTVTTAGGTSPANPVASFEYAEGIWAPTASLLTPRIDHSATLLANGKVLVAGGLASRGGPSLRSAELYDPLTGTWSATGSMASVRWRHTATLLADGRVLVAGGFEELLAGSNAQPVHDSAEIYDPATGTWSPTGAMTDRRGLHVAIRLPSGEVLAAGGRTCDQPPPAACNFLFRSDTAERYDPATGTWSPTGSLNIARHTTGAALLGTGDVLVPAGFTPSNNASAELYDPAAGTWGLTGELGQGRARQGATLLPNGKVLVVAGFGGGDSAELYNPETGLWELTGILDVDGRFNFTVGVLPNGLALVAGGALGGATTELFDPATGEWRSAGLMAHAHGSGSSLSNTDTGIVLSSDPDQFEADAAVCGANCGKLMVIGNNDGLGSIELYTSPPEATGIDVATGPTAGGTTVVITGSGFNEATSVRFGDVEASFTVDSYSQITVISPRGTDGTVDVTVTTPGGAVTIPAAFTFVASPRIDLSFACPPAEVPASGFVDIAGNVHETSIECLAWYGIARGAPAGLPADQYGPFLDVRRDQMASFIARMIDHADPDALPEAGTANAFPCDLEPDNVHFANIQRLAAAGVVLGGPGGSDPTCYGPGQQVRRDQMASFLNRAIDEVTGAPLASAANAFTDDEGNVHEANINGLAAEGIVVGTGGGLYDPAGSVRRDQMASFIARTLDYLVEEGFAATPA